MKIILLTVALIVVGLLYCEVLVNRKMIDLGIEGSEKHLSGSYELLKSINEIDKRLRAIEQRLPEEAPAEQGFWQ